MLKPGMLMLLYFITHRDIYNVFKNKTTYNLCQLQNTNKNG